LHHVALTVTDLEASVSWYERVFGVTYQMDTPHAGGVGKVLADESWQLMIALHRHDPGSAQPFSETLVGLDHVGFAVHQRTDLQSWQQRLEANGVQPAAAADRPLTQSPIADEPYGSVLVFRDPDNIQLELFAPRPKVQDDDTSSAATT
jgi:catechol 2,3-dioxygenase-like lactoylglutathione lyase family enzyme